MLLYMKLLIFWCVILFPQYHRAIRLPTFFDSTSFFFLFLGRVLCTCALNIGTIILVAYDFPSVCVTSFSFNFCVFVKLSKFQYESIMYDANHYDCINICDCMAFVYAEIHKKKIVRLFFLLNPPKKRNAINVRRRI